MNKHIMLCPCNYCLHADVLFQGLCKVVSHLLGKKQGHPLVVLVNLRDDVNVDCDTETFGVRDSTDLEEPVILYGVTRKDIEVHVGDIITLCLTEVNIRCIYSPGKIDFDMP